MWTRLRARAIVLPFTLLAVGAIVATNAGAASPLAHEQLVSPVRRTGTTPCAWTQALPALPATCTAAPTLANCTDPAWLKTPCGADPAIQKGYCQKVLVEEYCKDKSEEELVFPVANPKQTPNQALAGQNVNLFIPPGTTLGGRQMPYVPLPAKGGRPPPRAAFTGTPISQHSGVTSVRIQQNGMGTYSSATLPMWLAKYDAARPHVSALHLGVASARPAAQLAGSNDALFGLLAVDADAWVGDGSDTAAHRTVNSCAEFAYQRWYDYTHFKNAARALGRDYRATYHLAVDPKSPMHLEKATLRQFAIGALPDTWPTKYAYHDPTTDVPRNPFFTTPSFAQTVPKATQDAISQRIKDVLKNKGNYITLPPGAHSRFALHKQMRNELESRWHLSDDALDERQARQDRYAELLQSRQEVGGALACAMVPKTCCGWRPTATGGPLDGVLAKLRGSAVINPDPNQISSLGAYTGPVDSYNGFRQADQLRLGAAAVGLKALKGPDGRALGGMKQKSPPAVGQLATQTVPGAGVAVTPGGQTCEAQVASQLPRLQAAMNAIVAQLSDLVIKEFGIADGCLQDPGTTSLGNSCDWSYQKFAHFVTTYFDEAVEGDFKACNAATRGAFTTAKDPQKQGDVWPCEVRHDFGDDQLDTQYFIDAVTGKEPRKMCEARRAQQKVDEYLQANAEAVKKVPIRGDHVGESSGDTWSIGDQSTFGAYMQYNLGWEVAGGLNNAKTSDGAWCHPIGDGNMGAGAGFYFFGTNAKVLDAASSEETTGDGVYYSAHFAYYDMNEGSMKQLFPPIGKTKATSLPVVIPLSEPHMLGSLNYDFWIQIGPIPLHIVFGANASTGVDLEELGAPTAAASCNDKNKPIESIPLSFSTGTNFEPWVRADAFADASIDVVVASAGVHMDLNLLRLGLPTGVQASADTGKAFQMKTGSSLSVDALEGRVSAYVKVGIDPLSHSWEVTLFSWDGLHSEVLLFGKDDTVPLKVATWAAQSKIDPSSIACLPYKNPAVNAAGHPFCLKNPTLANDLQAKACAQPYTWPVGPGLAGWCNATSYALRGPTQ